MLYIPFLNFVYLAGPKTGSVSAFEYLTAVCEVNGIEKKTYSDFGLSEHNSYVDVHAALAAKHPAVPISFCTHIRHPILRVLSFFHFARLDKNLSPWWHANFSPNDPISFDDWFAHPGHEPGDDLAYGRWKAAFNYKAFCRSAEGAYPVIPLRLEDGMHALRDVLSRHMAGTGLNLTLPHPTEIPLNAGDSMAIEKGIALPSRQIVELGTAQQAQIRADWAMDMLLGEYQ